jgi:porin
MMQTLHRKLPCAIWFAVCIFAFSASAQTLPDETNSGPDSHETGQGPHGHLLGEWGGERSRLLERGVRFDLQYISDTLSNVRSPQPERLASWNRYRGTVDIDFGALTGQSGLYFHATALWQAGGNLGKDLGLLTNPSGMASANTFRLDSWWIEKRWLNERVTARLGQFAGQDSYGAEHYGASFIFEPMGYALNNLFTTYESFDPASTPAAEVRIVPARHLYVKSMIESEDRTPYANNITGLVPQFRWVPVSISEIGYSRGRSAATIHPVDDVESRKGYSGLFQFGAVYNPAKFVLPNAVTTRAGNYLLYWMASQALWRPVPQEGRGIDGTVAYDYSPADVNRNNRTLTAGLRFNEPMPLPIHNTMALGFVQNTLSSRFLRVGSQGWHDERGVEFNTLIDPLPMLLVQPVVQYYANVGGGVHRAVVFGFRVKVDF